MDEIDNMVGNMMANDPVAEQYRNRLDFDAEQEANQAMGPNASSLLQYLNDPEMERPAIRSGQKSRFVDMQPRSVQPRSARPVPENPWEMSNEEIRAAEIAKAEARERRQEELIDLYGDRTARDMSNARPFPGPEAEGQEIPTPMSTHHGQAGSGVSAIPRPLPEVERELAGQANFDHAAGPQNEKWQAAREKRQEAREERLSRHQAQEAAKAEARQRRLQSRQTASRPRSAGGSGALWRINPEAAAQLATRRGISQDRARAQLAQQQNELAASRPLRAAQAEQARAGAAESRATTAATEQALDEKERLKTQIQDLSNQLRDMDPSKPGYDALEEELDRSVDRLNALNAGTTPGGGRDRDQEVSRVTEEGDEVTTGLDDDLSSVAQSDVGNYYQIDAESPQTGSELAELVNDGLKPGAPIPQGDDLTALTEGLRLGSESVDPSREGAPRHATLQQSASRLPGDPEDAEAAMKVAKNRVRSAMKYLATPEGRRGDPPTVNGYKLTRKTENRRRRSGTDAYNPYSEHGSAGSDYGGYREYEYYTWERAE